MLWLMAPLIAVTAPQEAPQPFVANGSKAPGARLHIGDTGIRCLQMPCPSRAVFEPDEQGHAVKDRILFVDADGKAPLPPLIAKDSDRVVIFKAWEDRQCVAIDGRLIPGEEDRPILRVDRVLGPCDGAS